MLMDLVFYLRQLSHTHTRGVFIDFKLFSTGGLHSICVCLLSGKAIRDAFFHESLPVQPHRDGQNYRIVSFENHREFVSFSGWYLVNMYSQAIQLPYCDIFLESETVRKQMGDVFSFDLNLKCFWVTEYFCSGCEDWRSSSSSKASSRVSMVTHLFSSFFCPFL